MRQKFTVLTVFSFDAIHCYFTATKTFIMGKKKQKDQDKLTKSYKFTKSDIADNPNSDDTITKIVLKTNMEKSMVNLILDWKKTKKRQKDVSQRMTTKRLTDMYMSLARAGFKHNQIESAMRNTLIYGGDLVDALDWLCLNIANEDLPSDFSETLKREETKRRSGFQAEQIDKSQISAGFQIIEKPADRKKIEEKKDISGKSNANKDVDAVKNWILRYAELDSDSDSEDKEEDIDPNLHYKKLSENLDSVIDAAAKAKKCGDKESHRELSKTVRQMMADMDRLADHPNFDRKLAGISLMVPVKELPSKQGKQPKVLMQQQSNALSIPTFASAAAGTNKQKPDAKSSAVTTVSGENTHSKTKPQSNDEELGLDMIINSGEIPSKPAKKKKGPVIAARSFEYTRQQWTGKSPKQFLNDWVRKNLPKSDLPHYEKINISGNFKCRSSVVKKDSTLLTVTPEVLCFSVREAEHVGSTLLLYHLCKGQPIYQLLPPPYRDLWLEWAETEKQLKKEAQEINNKPRDQLVTKLLKELKLVPTQRSRSSNNLNADNDDDDVCDDWYTADVDDATEHDATENINKSKKTIVKPKLKPRQELKALLLEKLQTSQYQKLLIQRESLPVYNYKNDILAQIDRSKVVVIAGETGSGKSTQIPQFLLVDRLISGEECNIICTQPRRISAVSLANRVSQEIGDNPPGTPNSLCGYRIRFESRTTHTTCLTYCTTGVVLRQLHSDPELKMVTHIIVDEVHERTVQSDFLLIILKNLLEFRNDLKVILMSATIDCDRISDYFHHSPIIKIPGRLFPVNVSYLEDVIEMSNYVLEEDSPYSIPISQLCEEQKTTVAITGAGGMKQKTSLYWSKEDIVDLSGLDKETYSKHTRITVTRMKPYKVNMDLIFHLLNHIDLNGSEVEGAVLIFLPGLADIQELYELLQSDRKFSKSGKYQILALHSVLSSEDQSTAFKIPPRGVRKIVLATNIAETGITIPDVVYVIDSGKVKENRYIESSRMNALEEVFVSKASAKQRSGRAGRVRNGFCYRLYTKEAHHKFREFTIPELLRVALEELCLHIMKCELGKPEEFLQLALDPPQLPAISRAMNILEEIGACEDSVLTPLGHHLAVLPVHVSIGKMLIFGALFGCLEPTAVIAAAISGKSPFVVPLEKRSEANIAKQNLSIANSDHLTIYNAYSRWKTARKAGHDAEMAFCMQNYVKRKTLLEIESVKTDLIKLVKSVGFLSAKDEKQLIGAASWNSTIDSSPSVHLNPKLCALIKAVILAGLYPNVAKVCSEKDPDGTNRICGAEMPQGIAYVHPSSVNRMLQAQGYMTYQEKTKQSQVYLRDCTLVSPFPLLLFGHNIVVQHVQQTVTVDKWIIFKSRARTAVIFKEFRNLLNELLQEKLEEPQTDFQNDSSVLAVIDLIQADIC